MVKFKFFVHCSGWKDGGYSNSHFAENEHQARQIIERWNEKARDIAKRLGKEEVDGLVDLLEVKEISDEEFAEDYIPAYL